MSTSRHVLPARFGGVTWGAGERTDALAQAIRALRVERGWSIYDLSSTTGLSESYLRAIEFGRRVPRADALFDLEQGLSLAPGTFFRLWASASDADLPAILEAPYEAPEQPARQPHLEREQDLTQPLRDLRALLRAGEESERAYQLVLLKHPWALGLQYRDVERHSRLDHENVPDFTGVRVHDGARDIIEVKPPFLRLFTKGGQFSAAFNDSWNQAERYLQFARDEKDYLRRRGLTFSNPQCVLLVGFRLTEAQLARVRAKERLVPGITVLTYEGLLATVERTVAFLKDNAAPSPKERP